MWQYFKKGFLMKISHRFRGFLPVVVDVETGGFDPLKDALLEVAFVFIEHDDLRGWRRGDTENYHIEPFEGSNIEPSALNFNKIDPEHPFRFAISEKTFFEDIKKKLLVAIEQTKCKRAILVGHNSSFDLSFINAALRRNNISKFPLHSFSSFDTATLSGVFFGQTVLARAMVSAELKWNPANAHSAVYDAERTADLFCKILNLWDSRFVKT